MSIEPGQNLLHYRIVEKLGEGGMGAVWRAVDTTLDREVAIKVLPPAFSADAERVARFDREAKALASLNHSNIAAVHSVHHYESVRFIAMELVPGEDLAVVLARGRMDRDNALRIAIQIAEGLEAAHERGFVHRDLKPANVQLEPTGRAKILDFGLAKALLASPVAGGGSGDEPSLSLSPTMTASGTVAGMILGTAGYMSPEQARGQDADQRSDIWSFGCVLFEMLSGERVFDGKTVSDALASILKVDPDFGRLPADTPPPIRALLRRCLHKDPHHRLHDVADARIVIEDVLAGHDDSVTREPASKRARLLSVLTAAGVGLVAGALLWSTLSQDASTTGASGPGPVRRSWIPLPEGKPLNRGASISLSPDGSILALTAGIDAQSRLYWRRLDSVETELIPGTEGASSPFFSPDGGQLAFMAAGELKKVSLSGGGYNVTVLCDAPEGRKGTWDESGWIYFIVGESRLTRIREDGGDREDLGKIGSVYDVEALPDGRGTVLTLVGADSSSISKDSSRLAVLSPDATTVKPILDGGYNARYLPSGHLVFMRGGGLFAVQFDLERLEASPPAISVQPDVSTDSIWAVAHYDVSSDGTLVYVSGGDFARTVPTWIDLETGNEQALPVPPGIYNTFDLSFDGRQVAIQNASGAQDQIWVQDSLRDSFRRLTLEGANSNPVWSHDGSEVFFGSSRGGDGYRLYRQPVDGSAPASRLLSDEQGALLMETEWRAPSSVTPDGRSLLIYTWAHPIRGGDLWMVPLDGAGDPQAVLATNANEIIPQMSPDGKWLAYLSDRTGPYRIMVRPFPETEQREWVVSGGDAYDPRWSPRGDALLYRQGIGRLMRVPIGGGDEFAPGVAEELIETDFHDSEGSSFAVSPDGKRILVNKPVDASFWAETPVTLVTGWAGEVARVVGPN